MLKGIWLVKRTLPGLYRQSRPFKDVRLFVVGDGGGSVVEDVGVGRGVGLVERVGGEGTLGYGRRLGKDTLAGAAGVELVGREDSAYLEWFEHDVSPWFGPLNGTGLRVAFAGSQPLGFKKDGLVPL